MQPTKFYQRKVASDCINCNFFVSYFLQSHGKFHPLLQLLKILKVYYIVSSRDGEKSRERFSRKLWEALAASSRKGFSLFFQEDIFSLGTSAGQYYTQSLSTTPILCTLFYLSTLKSIFMFTFNWESKFMYKRESIGVVQVHIDNYFCEGKNRRQVEMSLVLSQPIPTFPYFSARLSVRSQIKTCFFPLNNWMKFKC